MDSIVEFASAIQATPVKPTLLLGRSPSAPAIVSTWRPAAGVDEVVDEIRTLNRDSNLGVLLIGRKRDGLLGESATVLVAILAGLAGGVLSAVGKDLWAAIKAGCSKLLARNPAQEQVVEVNIELTHYDLVFHFEPGSAGDFGEMADEALKIESTLKALLDQRSSVLRDAQTLLIARYKGTGKWIVTGYSGRRVDSMITRKPPKPRKGRRKGGA